MDYLERRKGQAVEVLSFTSHVLVDVSYDRLPVL